MNVSNARKLAINFLDIIMENRVGAEMDNLTDDELDFLDIIGYAYRCGENVGRQKENERTESYRNLCMKMIRARLDNDKNYGWDVK